MMKSAVKPHHIGFELEEMATYREEEDPFEEDIVFDQSGLLNTRTELKTAIRRVSSGKCMLFAKTIGLCGAFLGLGLCVAIPGPTLLDLKQQLQTDLSTMGLTYTSRAIGYFAGSIIGGVLFDCFNRQFMLFLSLLFTAIFISVIPFCTAVSVLISCMVVLGIAMGFLDTGGNVLCLDLWGRNSAPFMQALHFSFGLGAVVAPLLAAPFLEQMSVNGTTETNASLAGPEYPLHISNFKGDAVASVEHFNYALDRSKRDDHVLLNVHDNFTSQSVIDHDMVSISSVSPYSVVDDGLNSSQVTATNISFNSSSNSNATVSPSPKWETSTFQSTTKKKAPKPKPSYTDASKLDQSKDWNKQHVRKPPPEDLIPPSSTTRSTTDSLSISAVTTTMSTIMLDPTVSSDQNDSVPFYKERNFTGQEDSQTESPANGSDDVAAITTSTRIEMFDSSNLDSTTSLTNSTDAKVYNTTPENFTVASTGAVLSSVSAAESDMNSTTASHEINDDSLNVSVPNESTSMLTAVHNTESSIKHNDIPQSSLPVNPQVFSQIKEATENEETGEKPLAKSHLPYFEIASIQSTPGRAHEAVRNRELYVDDSNYQERNFDVEDDGSKTQPEPEPEPDTSDTSVGKSSISGVTSKKNDSPVLSSITSESSSVSTTMVTPKHHIPKPGTYDNDTENLSNVFDIFAKNIEKYGVTKIQFVYLIIGTFMLIIALVFLGFLFHNPRDPKSKQEEGTDVKKISDPVLKITLIILMSFFFFLYVGMEVAFGQLLVTFSVNSDLHLSKSSGSFVTAIFWGSFAATRFAAIFCANGLNPTVMLLLNFLMCTVGSTIESAVANQSETAFWIGSALLGIGMASMFPTGILWIERYIHVSNKIAAAFLVGSSLGEMVLPATMTHIMIDNPMILMYTMTGTNTLCLVTFVVMWVLASRHGEKYTAVGNNGYQLANQNDEEEDMIDMSPTGNSVPLRCRPSSSTEQVRLLNGHPHQGHQLP